MEPYNDCSKYGCDCSDSEFVLESESLQQSLEGYQIEEIGIEQVAAESLQNWFLEQEQLLQDIQYEAAKTAAGINQTVILDWNSQIQHASQCSNQSHEVVGPGCPCVPLPSSAIGKCQAGYKCSLITRKISQPTNMQLQGRIVDLSNGNMNATCTICAPGQYCNTSTFSMDNEVSALDCPPGWYCPNPASIIRCPPGYFCKGRNIAPISCDSRQLLKLQPLEIIRQVFQQNRQLFGNYCPAGSQAPHQPCPAGHYCPEAKRKVRCEKGAFCPERSIYPQTCPFLSECGDGKDKPLFSYLVMVQFTFTVLMLAIGYALLTRQKQKSQVLDEHKSYQKQVISLDGICEQEDGKKIVDPVVHLEFYNVGMSLPNGKRVISGISGQFKPGQLSAIMGPSGSGKTTFVNALCGKIDSHGEMNGEVRVNGYQLPRNAFKKIMGYVPQSDIVYEDLTVRENLLHKAHYGLSSSLSVSQKEVVVDSVLKILHLSDVQNELVGSTERRGISGGQRKRVNIGLELIVNPSVLFLDEPTSGLDATCSLDVLRALQRLTESGLNVVTVIHQPRYAIFSSFDQVMFLNCNGHTVYSGPPSLALDYFTSMGFHYIQFDSIADWCMDIVSGKITSENCDLEEHWESKGKYRLAQLMLQASEQEELQQYIIEDIIEFFIGHFEEIDSQQSGQIQPSSVVNFFEASGFYVSFSKLCEIWKLIFGEEFQAVRLQELVCVLKGWEIDNVPATILNETVVNIRKRFGSDFFCVGSRIEKHQREAIFAKKCCWCPNLKMLRQEEYEPDKIVPIISVDTAQPDNNTRSVYRPKLDSAKDFQMQTEFKQKGPQFVPKFILYPSIGRRKLLDSLKGRKCASIFTQLYTHITRLSLKKVREFVPLGILEIVLITAAGIVAGTVRRPGTDLLRVWTLYQCAFATFGVLLTLIHLRTFSQFQTQFQRELDSGMRLSAYFCGSVLMDVLVSLVSSIVFASFLWSMSVPYASPVWIFLGLLAVSWQVGGIAYLVSSLIRPSGVIIVGCMASIFFGLFVDGVSVTIAGTRNNSLMTIILGMSYNRWMIESLTISEFAGFPQHMQLEVIALLKYSGMCAWDTKLGEIVEPKDLVPYLDLIGQFLLGKDLLQDCWYHQMVAFIVVIAQGIGYRILAYVSLWYFHQYRRA